MLYVVEFSCDGLFHLFGGLRLDERTQVRWKVIDKFLSTELSDHRNQARYLPFDFYTRKCFQNIHYCIRYLQRHELSTFNQHMYDLDYRPVEQRSFGLAKKPAQLSYYYFGFKCSLQRQNKLHGCFTCPVIRFT